MMFSGAGLILVTPMLASAAPLVRRLSAKLPTLTQPASMSAKADERAFVHYDWMSGYGTEPTPGRPTDEVHERRFLADARPTRLAESPQAPSDDRHIRLEPPGMIT